MQVTAAARQHCKNVYSRKLHLPAMKVTKGISTLTKMANLTKAKDQERVGTLELYTVRLPPARLVSLFQEVQMVGADFPCHEWRPGGINAQPGAPKLGDTRYYNPAHTNGPNNIAPAGTIDHNSPSANLLSWYVKYGDPRWDDSPFTYDGHLFTGRMWFLKQKHIAKLVGFSEAEMNQKMNEKAANGSDFRSSGYG